MPLRKGRSKTVFKSNVREMVGSYKRTGKLGTSKPKSVRKAVKQAVAAAYTQQRRSSRRGK